MKSFIKKKIKKNQRRLTSISFTKKVTLDSVDISVYYCFIIVNQLLRLFLLIPSFTKYFIHYYTLTYIMEISIT